MHSWAIAYDTMYACQDRADDIKAGVKSTALLFGKYVKPIVGAFASAFALALGVSGYLNGNGPWYYIISVCGAAAHLVWQLSTWNEQETWAGGAKFKVSLLRVEILR